MTSASIDLDDILTTLEAIPLKDWDYSIRTEYGTDGTTRVFEGYSTKLNRKAAINMESNNVIIMLGSNASLHVRMNSCEEYFSLTYGGIRTRELYNRINEEKETIVIKTLNYITSP